MPQADPISRGSKVARAVDRVCVGAIAGAFGVHGEVRLKSFTDDPEAIADYGPLESEDGARRFDLKLTRAVKGGLAGRLSGVTDRNAAEALKGARLYVPRAALPEGDDEDEFYHADLIGLRVVDLSDAGLGRVKAVLNFGAGDLLEIALDAQHAPVLMPFTRETTPKIDLKARRVTIDPPEGMLGDSDHSDSDHGGGDLGDGDEKPPSGRAE